MRRRIITIEVVNIYHGCNYAIHVFSMRIKSFKFYYLVSGNIKFCIGYKMNAANRDLS